jgi:predicted enzyme related to lactoylglutathione lyase
MGKRDGFPPGTFSWTDLATSDVGAATAFYAGLFGWEPDDEQIVADSAYTALRLEGDLVCGVRELSEDERRAGVLPSWTSYVTVTDAEATAARATRIGGAVLGDTVEVSDLGRMALVADPQGASVAVWQPGTRSGAERVNDVGCLCMNELATGDVAAARSFYEELFGWTTEEVGGSDGPPLVMALNGETLNASLSPVEAGGAPHWRPYFTVESVEEGVRRLRELGGSELLGPEQIFDGAIAVVADPQGAVFALFAGEVDP